MSALSESGVQSSVIAIVAPIIWQWIDRHGDAVAFHIAGKVWFMPYSVTIKYSDSRLRGVIAQLIGPDPSGP